MDKSNSKVVVIGGAGFLGSHTADELTRQGYQVTVYDLAESPYLQPGQQMVVGDILDQDRLRSVVKGADYVYHYAGIADIDEAKKKPVETVKCNILGTTYIVDACRQFDVRRFFFASSIYVYSKYGSFYRSSKQACELIIENYSQVYDLKYTILRYGSLYGRRAGDDNSIYEMIKQALLNRKITRFGNGNEMRDYIHVLDAARASVEILERNYENSYVMVTGTQSMKVKDLVRLLSEMFDDKIEVEYVDGQFEEHYDMTPYSFRPSVAKKYVAQHYHDLGQGILDCIYEIYEKLDVTDKQKIPLNNPAP